MMGLALVAGYPQTALAEDSPPSGSQDESIAAEAPAEEGHEVIEIWDERPEKPFDRDTELRLDGEELAERGATNLAEAIELLPDIYVREAGRGGRQIDIRGARKGSIKILIDGIAVGDPFYGNFDLSSIPVTDIVQIRVSSSPSSPIDGTGGPGGVIEVHTRDAYGERLVEARIQGSSLPAADVAATGRMMLGSKWAVRVSSSAALGMHEFSVLMPDDTNMSIDEKRRSANGAARLEYRNGTRRFAADLWAQTRGFVVPPGDDGSAEVLVIDDETAGRIGLRLDDEARSWRLQGRAYAHALTRSSAYHEDATLTVETRTEDLAADREGMGFLANRPFGKHLHVIASAALDSEHGEVIDQNDMETGGRASVVALATGAQLELAGLDIDSAVGVAVPLGLGADPWPEVKLAVAYTPPTSPVTFKVTGARKGRVPTLRERFRTDIGNKALGPEHAWFGEAGVSIKPSPVVELEMSSYLRRTDGMIRFDGERAMLINTSELTLRGVDARVQIRPIRQLLGGASWSFTDAYSPLLGTNPLDFLPAHRADAWIGFRQASRYGGTVRVRYVGTQIDRGGDLPPYTATEISAYGRIGSTLTGSVKLGNIFDRHYDLRAGGVRSPGRVLSFTLRGSWD